MREREKWLNEKEEMEKRITKLERMVVKGGERRERRGWRKKNIERKLKEVEIKIELKERRKKKKMW